LNISLPSLILTFPKHSTKKYVSPQFVLVKVVWETTILAFQGEPC
jgi:hypothetical protein